MAISGKVALLGANGAVGRAMGPMLGSCGIPYRVVGRSLLALQVRFHGDPLCEHYQWDPEDKASLRGACSGAQAVVYLVGAALWKFKEHLPLVDRTLAAARETGVERFLLMSSNWSYGSPLSSDGGPGRVDEQHPRNPQTVKGKIRREQEDRVLRAHTPGVFRTGVLRVGDLYGPRVEASHLWSVFQAARRGGEAQMLGPIDRPHEFVFVPDAAATALALLAAEDAWGGLEAQAWNLGGAGATTILEMTKLIFAAEEAAPKYRIPGKMKMRYVRAINPYIRELREMQYLLEGSLLLDDSKLDTLLGGLHKTPYEEGVRQALTLLPSKSTAR